VVTGRFPAADDTARAAIDAVLASGPTLGRTRLVCVDGPAGSGKTTLAASLRRATRDAVGHTSVHLLHLDDVYEGWTGLSAGMRTVAEDVVEPLRRGEPGRYRRYDWVRDHLAEEHVVEPVEVLVLEGVGAGNASYADAITLLVWVETPPDVRLDRGLARDGEAMREHWLAWRAQEDAMFAEHRTRERADLVVDGRTGLSRG
jgi:uridine kinase